MTSYELHLLGLAVEATDGVGSLILYRPFKGASGGYRVSCWNEDGNNGPDGIGSTLAAALAALLTDLGVEVPERPSAERVEKAHEWATFRHEPEDQDLRADVVEFLRGLYQSEPLTVLALLESGGS